MLVTLNTPLPESTLEALDKLRLIVNAGDAGLVPGTVPARVRVRRVEGDLADAAAAERLCRAVSDCIDAFLVEGSVDPEA